MAGPEPIGRRLVGNRDLRVSLALLGVMLVLLAGLHVMLRGASWWFALALLAAVLLGVAALVRSLSRRRVLPPIVSALLLLALMTAIFVPGTAFIGVVPTTESWTAFGRIFDAAGLSINQQSLPAMADTPLMFLLCLGVGAIVIVADAIAVSLRAPAFAGIPLLVLLAVPSVVSIDSSDPIVFVLAVLAYLFLLRAGDERRQTRLSAALAVAVVAGTLVVPLALPPVTHAVDQGASGFSTGVNPVLSLGQDLRQNAQHAVLDYSTDSGNGQYLRLVSVEDFTGTNWGPSKFVVNPRNTPASISSSPGLSKQVATVGDTTYLQIRDLTSPWLPLPYPTTSVTGLAGNWYWDSSTLTVKSTNVTAQGESYRASTRVISPTPAQLQSAGTTIPAGFGRYLALPTTLPTIISSTADQVAGRASSNYEKALLLQAYFRSGDFQYSEIAPVSGGYDGTGMGAVAAFLQAKSGYCIHFASAMAVMARSLGIPSRVAVGFLPGTRLPEKIAGRAAYEVGSRDLHAWPELYFDGIGWTRFEPTVSRGTVPSYADQNTAGGPTPANTPDPVASNAPAPLPSSSHVPVRADTTNPFSTSSSTGSVLAGWLWALLALVLVAIVLLIPAFVRVRQRRTRLRELRRGLATPLAAWREVLQTAEDLGRAVSETATPREVRVLLGGGMLAEDAALTRMIDAVEHESYGTGGRAYPEAEADTRAIVRTLRSGTERATRLRAVLSPRSIWSRLLRPFRGTD